MVSKLFNIKCDNCGAEYRINSRGEMNCPFCGSRIYLNDKDWEDYQKARDEMLVRDRVENDLVNSDGDILHKWQNEQIITLETKSGKVLNLHYCYKFDKSDKTVYVGSKRVSIVYANEDIAQKAIQNVESLLYPSADIKGLSTFFPIINLIVTITDGKCVVVMEKPENAYPLAIFNKLDAKHVAWMISRLENFGCLFEFNGVGRSLEIEDVYINPKTHFMYLLDGWETLKEGETLRYLTDLREITKKQMKLETSPKECIDFLNGDPERDAYSDFDCWNKVIETGFGGHNFCQFTEN